MTSELQELTEKCLIRAKDFDNWIARNLPKRVGTRHQLSSELADQVRKRCRELKNLHLAASMPVAVAVYGASQAGKSLFVGRLLESRKPGETVLGFDPKDAPIPDLDFLNDFNPQGGGEATAVVTRFTLGKGLADSMRADGFPIIGRLLNRSDLLKSMARGFKGECKSDEQEQDWDGDEVERLLRDDIHRKYPSEVVDTDWRLDICEAHDFLVKEYCDRSITISEDALADLLRRYPLNNEGYVKLCCNLFWYDMDLLNNLFVKLLKLRDDVGGESDLVFMEWGVIPYILDSLAPDEFKHKRLPHTAWKDFGVERKEGKVLVGKKGGARLDLRLFQGLICELVVPLYADNLTEQVKSLFETADVLDIPGAVGDAGRARLSKEQLQEKAETSQTPPEYEILKRGRVGYLFEKYAAEKQIVSLAYMQRWGNITAKSEIGPQLDKWGKSTYGSAWPRAMGSSKETRNALYIAMTQIDKECSWNAAPKTEVFDGIIHGQLAANLHFMMGFGGDSTPFDNVYLMRHPGKTDMNPAFTDPVHAKNWKDEFLDSSAVRKHVANPGEKWDCAFSDDGGLTLYLNDLTQSIDGESHRKRLRSALDSHWGALSSEMERLYVDPSLSKVKKRMEETTEKLIRWFENDNTGWRSKHFRDAISCDPAIIAGTISDAMGTMAIQNKVDYEDVVLQVMMKWESSRKWEDMLLMCQDADIKVDVFTHYAGYLKDYLSQRCSKALAVSLKEMIGDDLSPGSLVENPKDHRQAIYSSMLFDDYLLTPGPREESSDLPAETETGSYLFSSAIPARYNRILLERLALGLGEAGQIDPPAGNDELIELISSL
jgi:hypothetical protein